MLTSSPACPRQAFGLAAAVVTTVGCRDALIGCTVLTPNEVRARFTMLTRLLLPAALLIAAPALAQTAAAPPDSIRRAPPDIIRRAPVIDTCRSGLKAFCSEESFEAGRRSFEAGRRLDRLLQCIERNADKVSAADLRSFCDGQEGP
jgi:hypothetical protein